MFLQVQVPKRPRKNIVREVRVFPQHDMSSVMPSALIGLLVSSETRLLRPADPCGMPKHVGRSATLANLLDE